MTMQLRHTNKQQAASESVTLTDEALLAAYRQTGERALFSELVKRYENELFNFLFRYVGDAQMAEDVFQNTFYLVHSKCEQFEIGRRFRPWLYAIATNAAIDAQRSERRHKAASLDRSRGADSGDDEMRLADLLASDEASPIDEATRLENGAWVQQALEGLNHQMRDVVHLVYYQGLKYREAADTLNVPVGTIKSRMHAAIQKLTEFWRQSHSE